MNEDQLKNFKACLATSVVKFKYSKKDGSIREAVGTLSEDIITGSGGSMPKGTGETPVNTVPYWDLDKNGWRCCIIDNIIEFEQN